MPEQDKNIFMKIHNEYSHFTASEKKIADYVLSHKIAVQYMSISELADECHVAEATLSRFCRRLRLKGYNDFKLALAKATVRHEANAETPQTEKPETEGDKQPEDPMLEICRKLYATHTAALGQTMAMIQPEKVRLAVDYIEKADRIYCMGQGSSMVLAMEAVSVMSTIRPRFFPVQDSHAQASAAALMNERDVVLFFSYSGSTVEIVDLIELAKERGAKVILVTRFLRSPGGRRADVVLQCGSLEGPLQLGSVAAKMAQLFVIDVLYNELCRRDPEAVRSGQENIAKALAEKHL